MNTRSKRRLDARAGPPRLGLRLLGGAALAAGLLASEPGDATARLAYLDPTAASFLFQALVATLAGASVALRCRLKRLLASVRRAPPEDTEDAAPPDATADA